MDIKEKIENLVIQALKNLGIEAERIVLEHPAGFKNGDYSTNIALKEFSSRFVSNRDFYKEIMEKRTGEIKSKSDHMVAFLGWLDGKHEIKTAKDFASILASAIEISGINEISKIEVAGPGFINFYLSNEYHSERLKDILNKGKSYGKASIYKNKNILVEHSSPNLFKPFHIGHVMNNAIGESISRFAEFSGADLKVISYPSDVSYGIGKAVWALLHDNGLEKIALLKNPESKVAYLGNCYVQGTRALESDPSLESEMRRITKLIYDETESPEYEAYKISKQINLDYFKNITKKLGSTFDSFIFESEAAKEGESIVRANIGNIFKESEGAIIYEGEQDGLHTRVFINKEGYPTYEAKDIGLLSLKFSRYNPDLSIFITDHEQSEYFKVVISAAAKINRIWKDRTVHRTHGRMSFKGQKMSSRLGGVPLASDILEVLLSEIAEVTKDRENVSPKENPEAIAISALKFTILKSAAGKNINFDPETSLSFEGDSGPYLQYSAVRSKSILEKVKNINLDFIPKNGDISEVEKYLDRFEEVVLRCINLWEPHHMVDYLLDLAQSFNSWYVKVKVIDQENPEMNYNVAIVSAFYQTMKNGLYLLGIETPEKM